MAPSQADIRHAIYLSLLMMAVGGTAAAATKHLSATVPVLAIVCVQYGICLALCLPTALRRGPAQLRTQRLTLHLVRGLLGVGGFYLYYAAMARIPLMDAMLLRQSAPLTVPLVMWLWQRQRVSGSAWLPLVIGFIGIIVIIRPAGDGISWWHLAGFVSALTLSGSMVATHKLATTESGDRILFYYFALSFACALPFAAVQLPAINTHEWMVLAYIGVAMYLTLWLYTRAYSMAPASAIAPINYIGVAFAGLLGWLLWGERPDIPALIGSTLVVAGGLLTIYLARDKAG